MSFFGKAKGILALGRIPYGPASGPGDVSPIVAYGSASSRNRLEGNDLQTWIEPVDFSNQYQSFWVGNQLPGAHIQTPPHAWYLDMVNSDQVNGWQRNAVTFTSQLGQVPTSNLLARWHALWQGSN